MVSIKSLNSYRIGTFVLDTKYVIRQYYEFSNVFVSREEDDDGNGHLFAYGYSSRNYELIWTFPNKDVFAISRIVPELKNVEEFTSLKHYDEYLKKYKGKELLQVYSSNWPYDFRFVVDANTGKIYDKMESH